MNAIISIAPCYAKSILSGHKKYEFRKSFFREKPKKVYLYATKPIQKIVGHFTIANIWRMQKDDLWRKVAGYAGVTKAEFDDYYANSENAVAIEIGKVHAFTKPKKYQEIDIFGCPPISYKKLPLQ